MATADTASHVLALATGWVVLAFVTIAGGAIVYRMWNGDIDLSEVISEPSGDASMSRFQLLIFTFVIAVSLFAIIADQHVFPQIPQGVLVLLGISGSSYLVSKGIQFSSAEGVTGGAPTVTIAPQRAFVAADGASSATFTATTAKDGDAVTWALFPATGAGAITQNGVYTAPSALPTSPYVVVQATTKDNATDVAVVELH